MTAVSYGNRTRWIGLATEKPAADAVPIGATYFETDTPAMKVSDGVTWQDAPPQAVTGITGGGGSGGTEYTEDGVSPGNPVAPATMLRQRASPTDEGAANGDWVAQNGTSKGEAFVKNVDADALTGAVNETAPSTDTGSAGLNGRLQRVAQRLTSLMALVGEVQASPTSNTVLDRLKTIATALAGTLTVNASITDSPAQAAPGAGSSFGNSKQLKVSAGYLLGFSVHNKGSSTLYVALYNAASKTGTALMYWPVYAAETLSVSFGEIGLYLDTGGFLQAVTDHDGTDTSDATSSLKFMGRMI